MNKKIITLIIQETGGDTSPVSVYIGDSGTGGIEDEDSFRDVYLKPLWDTIRPIVNGVLVGARAAVEYDVSTWLNNTFDVISDIEEKAVFVFVPCNSKARVVRLSLPTIKEEIFINDGAGKFVDLTNSDVAAYVHIMTNDLDEQGIDALDSHGNELCYLSEGLSIFKD